jgi:signal transduction histidine kinase/ligand-binding sensor domain-containing protein
MPRGRLRSICRAAALTLAATGTRVSGVARGSTTPAPSPALPLSDYVITSWTTKDGLPSDVIWSIAQDQEGYLWLGTSGGLVRFDGVRFVTRQQIGGTPLPHAPVRKVYVARDGSLWVGFMEAAGVSRISGDSVRHFTEREGLPRVTVADFLEEPDGSLWAGGSAGLFSWRADRDRWTAESGQHGLPETRVDSLFLDRDGHLLVGTSAGVFRRARGSGRFELIDTIDDTAPRFRGFSQDPSGRVWVSDATVGFRPLGRQRLTRAAAADQGRGNYPLVDREGSLWLATMGEGIWRIRNPGTPRESVEKARVLGARVVFLDDQDNIWTAAGDGLSRLRKPRVIPVTNLGLVSAVEASPDGSVWAATADELIQFPAGATQPYTRQPVKGARISAIRSDRATGALWVATNGGILRCWPGRVEWFPVEEHTFALGRVNSIAPAPGGRLWMSHRERGLFRWHPQRPDVFEQPAHMAPVRANSLYSDSAGRVWVTGVTARLGLIEPDGTTRSYGPQDGLGPGPYNGVLEDSHAVLWVGGSDGLSRMVGGRFVKLDMSNRFRGGAAGLVEDDDGDLWLGTASGIVSVTRSELDRLTARPDHEVRATLFEAADGLAGMPINFGSPSIARARDGRIWFVTGRGLSVLEPQSLKTPGTPPEVRIESVVADEQPVPVAARPTLSADTSRLEIDYTALELTTPFRTRFRYRLEGLDADWIDAGTRRQAIYRDLPARHYRFQVVASTSDGGWSDAAAVWEFSIPPRFYQTASFMSLCVGTVLAFTWALWQLRLRRVRRQFALLIGERARLSREIHDTLLQSLFGVALQCDAVSNSLEPTSATRHQLVRLRKQVEAHIREARHSIWNLRAPTLAARDLPGALRDVIERLVSGTALDAEVSVRGTPYSISGDADEQLLRIAQEAVLNAVRHAHAEHVQVVLAYSRDGIGLRVSDDGRGFDPSSAEGEASGHYGLVSMRERAAEVGGRLTITSARGEGTVAEAWVPAPRRATDMDLSPAAARVRESLARHG